MPLAAVANGFWLGDLPEHLRGATFIEMAASSPVRINGIVVVLDELRVGRVGGSAKSVLRGTVTLYYQDSYGVQLQLPACDEDVPESFTCALVGFRTTDAQLRRLFRACRSTVEALLAFQLDRNNELVGGHTLAREAQLSPKNLDTYENEGSVPKAILDALVPVSDSTIANARSTHPHGNREPESGVPGGDPDVGIDDGVSYIIETNAVMPTGSDLAVSSHCRPCHLRSLGAAFAFTSEDARNDVCVWCTHDEFLEGVSWGLRCTHCDTHMSITSGEEKTRPLLCLACSRKLDRETTYVRLVDPSGQNKKNGAPLMRYIHGDGTACLPLLANSTSVHPCNRCRKCSPDVDVRDSSGDDSSSFIRCLDCFYEERSELMVDVRALMTSAKARATADSTTSPQKKQSSRDH